MCGVLSAGLAARCPSSLNLEHKGSPLRFKRYRCSYRWMQSLGPPLPIAILQCPSVSCSLPSSPPRLGLLCLDVCHDELKGAGTSPSALMFPQTCLDIAPLNRPRTIMSLSPWNFSHSPSCQELSSQPVSVICDGSQQSSLLRSPNLALDLGNLGSQHDWLWKVWLKLDTEQWLFCWLWWYLPSLRINTCCWFNGWEDMGQPALLQIKIH